MLVVLIPFYLFDWESATRLTAYSTAAGLTPFCESVIAAGGAEIVCDGWVFVFSKECTYLDLFLASAPFVWRSRRSVAVNLRRIAAVLSLIWVINMLRLVGGLAAYVHGVQWKLAHDIPDMMVYWPLLGIVLVSYWRSVAHTGGTPDAEGQPELLGTAATEVVQA